MCILTNKIDYGKWNPDRLETDDEDLMRTIYAYYCNAGYPKSLQDAIDTTIQILDSGDNTYLEIEALIMEMAGAADLWGFRQGFRAAVELLSGNTFRKIFDKEEPDGKPLTSCMGSSRILTITEKPITTSKPRK